MANTLMPAAGPVRAGPTIGIILLTIVAGVLMVALGDRMPVNQGLGYDGSEYARITTGLFDKDFTGLVSDHRLRRISPPVVANLCLRVLGLDRQKPANIIAVFLALDILLMALSAWLWCRIASVLSLSRSGLWIGYVSLFVTHASLRHAYFYPVLTDCAGFCLGLLLVYLYLTRRPILLLGVVLLGSFTWPPVPYEGLLLYLFPRRAQGGESPAEEAAPPARGWLGYLAGAGVALGLLMLVLYLQYRPLLIPGRSEYLYPNRADPPIPAYLPVTWAAAALYATLGLGWLLGCLNAGRAVSLARSLFSISAVIGLAVFLLPQIVCRLYPNHEPYEGFANQFSWMAYSCIAKPAGFLLAHILYFGPILLLAILFWGRVCAIIHALGWGWVFSTALMLAMGLGSESRQLISFVPLVVIPTVLMIDRGGGWPCWKTAVFVVVSLIASKVWLPMGSEAFSHLLHYPAQWYYLNHGPWMTWHSYWVQLAAVVPVGVLFYFLYRPGAAPVAAERPGSRSVAAGCADP